MLRLCFLAVLIAFSSSAEAGGSISFTVGGHRVHIESSRYCRSTSCASVSISGTGRKYVREDDDRNSVAPVTHAPPVAPAVQPSPPVAAPRAQTIVASPPAVYTPAASTTQTVAAPPPAAVPVPPPPPIARPVEAARPMPQITNVSQRVEEELSDSPIGDWQTGARGTVRIVKCGNALCGYVLDSLSDDKGEAILVNMKPKTDRQWIGSVYSQESGDTYYGTIDMKGLNTLRVEACAIGRFYCSGNNWSRIGGQTGALITSRQTKPEPRS
ncbi:MAG: DUF2147 domain-containing protein [bacterium]|nr:DUF2147 domain-containing protein [bacterium]